MKTCNNCKIEKPLAEFHKNRGTCKLCRKMKQREYLSRDEIKIKRNNKQKEWYSKNKDKAKKYQKDYYLENKDIHNKKMEEYHSRPEIVEKRKTYSRDYYEKNIGKIKAKSAKRRATLRNATLPGYDEEIKEIYATCPKGYHVDHIMPLQGENLCGLHVPWNLQHLEARENLKKGNKIKRVSKI